jgi:predicted nucleotidyltransferase
MSVLKLPEWAKGIGCYGSFVKGTNNTDSDLDLFVFVEKYSYELEIKAAKIERNTEKVIGSETNILILTEDKLMEMQENDQPFYNSLIRTAVTLRGVHIEEY